MNIFIFIVIVVTKVDCGMVQPHYNASCYSAHSVIMLIGRWIPLKMMVLFFNHLTSY